MHRRGRRARRGGEKRECFRSVGPREHCTASINSGYIPYDGESGVVRRPSSVGECGIIDLDLIIPMQPETILYLTASILLGSKIYLASRSDSEHYERKLSLGCSHYHFPDIAPLSLNSSRLTRAS
jgi:hypothetical protein